MSTTSLASMSSKLTVPLSDRSCAEASAASRIAAAAVALTVGAVRHDDDLAHFRSDVVDAGALSRGLNWYRAVPLSDPRLTRGQVTVDYHLVEQLPGAVAVAKVKVGARQFQPLLSGCLGIHGLDVVIGHGTVYRGYARYARTLGG